MRYPTGVRPLLIDETARRRRVEARVVSILEREGFAEVILPIIDYAEPYAAAAELDARHTYRFVDRDGDLVAIRSDFTPMVARALAPEISRATLPLRVFYRGDVVRLDPPRLGRQRELFQIGAEIIGDPSVEAEIALLTMVSEMAGAMGVEPMIVCSDGSAAIEEARIPGCVLHSDDGEPRGYYTGLRFRAYDSSARGVVIAQGGRYDGLYERFGQAAPAAGFTLTINDSR